MPASEDTRQYKTFGHQVVEETETFWSREGLLANIQKLVGSCSDTCLVVWGLCCPCWEHEGAMIRFIPSDLLISSRHATWSGPDIIMRVLIAKIKIKSD